MNLSGCMNHRHIELQKKVRSNSLSAERSHMANGTWSYDETVMAFIMYCKMEFGKTHHHNLVIIEFAKVLGRTPSAVSMKMGNLARFDPELRKRGIKGLQNGSKMEAKWKKECGMIFKTIAWNWLYMVKNVDKTKREEHKFFAGIRKAGIDGGKDAVTNRFVAGEYFTKTYWARFFQKNNPSIIWAQVLHYRHQCTDFSNCQSY